MDRSGERCGWQPLVGQERGLGWASEAHLRLQGEAHAGGWFSFVVTRLDRPGRNAMDVRATIDTLAAMSVRVHCLQPGGTDLTSAVPFSL